MMGELHTLGASDRMGSVAQRLAGALRTTIRGEVRFDGGTLAAYASDSSNYRHVPIGVVMPVDHDDVVAALRVCAAFDAPVLARGAGTSLAGQACNAAVIVDTSRHMTRILDVDPRARTARVEPGVILDDLRRACEPHGLTFGPDPATHAWCTLGGMIGNNACGSHALVAGKTVDNVERLRMVLYGGAAIEVGQGADRRGSDAASEDVLVAAVTALEAIVERSGAAIRTGYPDMPRRVSGYNLDELLPERGFHLARALVGTESTCGIVTEAVVRLTDRPRNPQLVVMGFPSLFAAADAVPELLRHPLLALEGFDGKLVDQMRQRPLNVEHLSLLPIGDAWLIAELGGDSVAAAAAAAETLIASLPPDASWRRYDDTERQARVWLVRESGLGATAITSDGGRNHEGWEDAAVAPAKLGSYLRGITALWSEFGYSGAWYGHFGQGCVHTRNNFDFATPQGLRAYRSFVERAADLVVSLGGSLSGEHGDGQARSELLGRMYGSELLGAFRSFKAAFDPRGRMNPGRIVDPAPLDADLRYGPRHRHPELAMTAFALGTRHGRSLQGGAERCVGVGKCRRDDAGVMCPSYRATRDERHSTRGRARILAEMFQGEVNSTIWRNEDVRAALDLCLSCKGCLVDCPTQVDMATYKAEFMSNYYAGHLRPRAMYVFGWLPWLVRLLRPSLLVGATNTALNAPVIGTALRWLVGVTPHRRIPRLARRPFRRTTTARARRDDMAATVVVWPDSFTDAFRPHVAEDLVAVLEGLGEKVAVPSRWGCCGRPLYDAGMLGRARKSLVRVLDILEPWTSTGTPVVVPEPSCLAVFRDELPALLFNERRARVLADLARSPAEHLLTLNALRERVTDRLPDGETERVVVHPHCHGRAIGTPKADRKLLEVMGYSVEVLDGGCCGLAGSFGFKAEHAPISRTIGTQQWLPRLAKALEQGDAPCKLVVDGFSCGVQLAELSAIQATSLPAVVRERLLG